MPLLFSYGTLQEDHVQLSTFGRRLEGVRDALVGCERSRVRIEDPLAVASLGKTHHDNVTFVGDDDSRVAGMVFEVTDAELARADEYEAPFSFARVTARLASGRSAWVYVHSAPPGGP
jgi:gamma-glutamylcyclotransferase (GGCT)/AIG2-like uncharacterized protein YtfP